MSILLARIRQHAARRPHAPALADERGTLDYRGLLGEAERLAALLAGQRVGLLMDNGAPWAVADLAISAGDGVSVPIPGFFSETQRRHLIEDAGLDLVVTDRPPADDDLLAGTTVSAITVAGRGAWLCEQRPAVVGVRPQLPPGTVKVTYTSGTTGQPKGVCLSGEIIATVTAALCAAVSARADDCSLSLLPLSTLLENIGGLYAPLYAGAVARVPALAACGIDGSSGLRPAQLFASLTRHRPTSVILVPQLLKALTACVAAGAPAPASLRFAAVGGAPCSPALLAQARSLGIPAFEGYGLSEAASVVSLNLPTHDRLGSVGRPLPHAGVSISEQGEVIIHGGGFLGYLGESPRRQRSWPTGDLGRLDGDGFLYLTGRRKTAYATSFGRNVAPEWVESELTAHPAIAQAAVFGEARPFNAAVLVPRGTASECEIAAALHAVNARLPDYARVRRWVIATEAFTPGNGLATGGGALRREAVGARYRARIEQIYEGADADVVL